MQQLLVFALIHSTISVSSDNKYDSYDESAGRIAVIAQRIGYNRVSAVIGQEYIGNDWEQYLNYLRERCPMPIEMQPGSLYRLNFIHLERFGRDPEVVSVVEEIRQLPINAEPRIEDVNPGRSYVDRKRLREKYDESMGKLLLVCRFRENNKIAHILGEKYIGNDWARYVDQVAHPYRFCWNIRISNDVFEKIEQDFSNNSDILIAMNEIKNLYGLSREEAIARSQRIANLDRCSLIYSS